ncbi:MAG: UDP-N-acetylmuramoyl-L-alanyl-D-glutamate--2,6-diaminopimelate ligase, partial [Ruminococcaceae bacterium]|nr:UDP-N-acetylmuramoyl-L-alanyl-D-glutamate--2,6-diaminopimelate ligase [Oscillospiraceae bacterium]
GGKTSVEYILKHMLEKAGHKVGCITTTASLAGDEVIPLGDHGGSSVEDAAGAMTTPDPEYFYGAIAMMRDAGCDVLLYEASSHGLDLRKTDGVRPKIAIFTNLAREHLDYHGTMEAYLAVKARLFSSMGAEIGILCGDDPYCDALIRLAGQTPGNPIRFLTCGMGRNLQRNVTAMRFADHGAEGISYLYCGDDAIFRLKTPLVGKYSVYNTMEAACAALQMGVDPVTVKEAAADMPCVPGRMQKLDLADAPFSVYLDYAHTPAALTGVLETALAMNPERLTVVFGCGGNRDKGKRPLMGQAAQKLAHRVIVTSDNARFEDPSAIIADITAGMEETVPYEVIPDRREAILYSVRTAVAGEILLLCGKGHENYEIRGGAKIPFDEEAIVREALSGMKPGRNEFE